MTRHTASAGVGALTLVAVLLTACGQDHGVRAAGPLTSDSSQTADQSPSLQSVVRSIGITQHSVPARYRSGNSMPQGDEVSGQVTLDLCGGTFRSEALRVARHQVAYVARDHRSSLSSETVAYRSGGAALAMREVRRAIKNCPSGYVGSRVAGQPLRKEHYARLAPSSDWEPGTIAVRVSYTDQTGRSGSGVVIYQRHADLLSGTYAWGSGPSVLRAVRSSASLMKREMDAAPAVAASTRS